MAFRYSLLRIALCVPLARAAHAEDWPGSVHTIRRPTEHRSYERAARVADNGRLRSPISSEDGRDERLGAARGLGLADRPTRAPSTEDRPLTRGAVHAFRRIVGRIRDQ
jgi:hypothetical protein